MLSMGAVANANGPPTEATWTVSTAIQNDMVGVNVEILDNNLAGIVALNLNAPAIDVDRPVLVLGNNDVGTNVAPSNGIRCDNGRFDNVATTTTATTAEYGVGWVSEVTPPLITQMSSAFEPLNNRHFRFDSAAVHEVETPVICLMTGYSKNLFDVDHYENAGAANTC